MPDQFEKLQELTEKLTKAESIIHSISKVQAMYIVKKPKEEIFEALLKILLESTESEYGFIGEILEDEATKARYLKTHAITNIAWDEATRKFYDENAPKGLEFRNLDTLFGETIKTGKTVMSNDPANHDKAGGIPKGHPPLNAYLGIPLYVGDQFIGMCGISNRPSGYDEELVKYIEPLVTAVSQLVYAHRLEKKVENK